MKNTNDDAISAIFQAQVNVRQAISLSATTASTDVLDSLTSALSALSDAEGYMMEETDEQIETVNDDEESN